MDELIKRMKADGWSVRHETAGTVTFVRPDDEEGYTGDNEGDGSTASDYVSSEIVLSVGLEVFDVLRWGLPTRRWEWERVDDVLEVAKRERPVGSHGGGYAPGGERIQGSHLHRFGGYRDYDDFKTRGQ
jgi:hypothetical protein